MLDVRKSTIAEFESAASFPALLKGYADECAIFGLPSPAAKMEMYRALEKNKAMHCLGAFFNQELIGFLTILTSVLPHYGVMVAVGESYFVAKEHRKTGAGLKLLHMGKAHTQELHAPGFLVSALVGSDLAEILPNVGFEETNRVFFWRNKNV